MSTTTMTTTLGTSNLRGGPPRQTRSNPLRYTKGLGHPPVRNNSLLSNSSLQAPSSTVPATNSQNTATTDGPGLYPAITHFADAIAALPREFRRHNSLLKEVDAKAWLPEENLQTILRQCLSEITSSPLTLPSINQSLAVPATADDVAPSSDAHSVTGASLDNASLVSALSTDPALLQRRQQFHALRQNLIAIMVTMDEKNHVINNANEEVARSIRRLSKIYPNVSLEISEEARLGSLKHWAYTETNPVKKPTAPATRTRDAAANAAAGHESEVAHRSESRREAMLARKQRAAPQVDSDFDESRPGQRKGLTNGKRKGVETPTDPAGLGIIGAATATSKRKKTEKAAAGGTAMERSVSSAMGGRAMSRENSQTENAKKRKASGPPAATMRKRLNASVQDSPKLASSPLAGNAGKEAYKKSPALASVRPVGRGRQNSTQTIDSTKGRPSSSSASQRNGTNAARGSTPEGQAATAATVKGSADNKSMAKETKLEKAERLAQDEPSAVNGANVGQTTARGAVALERTSSKAGSVKGEVKAMDEVTSKKVASPRIPPALLNLSEIRNERGGRGRTSKTSTPVVGTFSEAEFNDSNGSASGGNAPKIRRPARPRVKDHGLHDSLSPKGLPVKRSHKKNGSVSTIGALPLTSSSNQRLMNDTDASLSRTPSEHGAKEREDEDEENEMAEEDEERYCYCQGVSYGEMVACDKPDCPMQWFHLDCIGLKSVPKSAKWYCDECKETLAKKNKAVGGSNGGGGAIGSGLGK
ncbi:hypothetical protein, variant [Exophiala mesophila]|uniref:Chromatin modification-related protein n=1 Tax=Exophiala mesophila TaxID=212818 RepID=A0A0D1X833_EXOME|nr:hypothetical protein, variant [Exophiala mesophila]KIV98090.1 hypothetical protein, variant [Exophiala mesophila]